MTEYDYSPQAIRQYHDKLNSVSNWVAQTRRATKPFGPVLGPPPTIAQAGADSPAPPSSSSSHTLRPTNIRSHTLPAPRSHPQQHQQPHIRTRGLSSDFRDPSPPDHPAFAAHQHHHRRSQSQSQSHHHHGSAPPSYPSRSRHSSSAPRTPVRSNTSPPQYRIIDPYTHKEIFHAPLGPEKHIFALPPEYQVIPPGTAPHRSSSYRHHHHHHHQEHPHQYQQQQPLLRRLLTSLTGSRSRDSSHSSSSRSRHNSGRNHHDHHHSRRRSY